MAKSQSWSALTAHGLGLFLLLATLFLLPTSVSAKALVAADGQTGDPDYTCSADKPCALGCCNNNGICGMGPEFCSPENCVNSCDAKSECDPSNWGPQYAANEKCPLNVCCSKYGFCGTTSEFCGDTQIANPSCPGGKSATLRTIGYYEGWGVGRACDAMLPEEVPVAAYTHINFAFAMIDPVTFAVAPMSDGDVGLYPRLTGLKELYPDLKVWISIGGWSMNDPDQPTATTFSDVAGSTANQQKFFASLISFMSNYGFDGVDIDWEYPVAPERSGRPEDYQNYPIFLQNLRNAFQAAGKSWGLTITMPSSFWYLQHFDIVKLEPVVDWFNMMEYDIHGTWDATSVWAGPFVAAHTNLTEIDQSMKLLWRNGINPAKVVLGLGFYGRSYTLQDPSCNTAGCPFTAGGPAGPCTDSVGTLSYGEIERLIQAGAKPVLDSAAAVQTLTYGGNNWVSYDDQTTLKMKVDYANNNCLGGTMVWAASTDDSNGSAAQALAAASGFTTGPQGTHIGVVVPSDNPGLCSWTTCGAPCPAGTPNKDPFSYRLFCCPSNDVPKCEQHAETLQGQTCIAGSCPAGTQLLTTTQFILVPFQICSAGGHLNWCCSQSKSLTNTIGQCTWTDCGGSCPSGTSALTQTLTGDGGDTPCTSGRRSLCCPTSGGTGFISSTCGWYRNAYHDTCTPGCPASKVQLAVDSAGANCVRGYGSFCCDPPVNSLDGRSAPQVKDFAHIVDAFMTEGTCTAHNGGSIPRRKKRGPSSDSSFSVTSYDMALKLSPLLFLWARQPFQREYVTPFQEVWDAAVSAHGNIFAKFGGMASAMQAYNPIEGDSISYLDNILCYGKFGAESINDQGAASNYLCTRIGPQAIKRGDVVDFVPHLRRSVAVASTTHNKETDKHGKRWFWDKFHDGGSSDLGIPTTGDAFTAIVDGTLRPEYFTFFRYQGTQIEMEVVFLLGPNPTSIVTNLRNEESQNFLVMHIHFNPTGLINGRLAIDQINIRHAGTIRSREATPTPGRYTAGTSEPLGERVFACDNPATGMDPATPLAGNTLREQRVSQVVQLLSRWGVNNDLFNQNTPDPSTYLHVEVGPRTGQIKRTPPPDRVPRLMFTGARFAEGNGGVAFAPDGSLYDPQTRNQGDLISHPGFYVPYTT